ncbi:hypothetical protein [Nocardia sp. IFM 10818]
MSENASPETTPDAVSNSQAQANSLPDWAQKKLTDANAEAANYRVQKNNAVAANQQLTEQVTALTTDKAGLQEQLATATANNLKLLTAIDSGVPGEHVRNFASLLQGSTAEELSTHAEALKTMFGMTQASVPATDPSQGLSGGAANDPAAAFGALLKSHLR